MGPFTTDPVAGRYVGKQWRGVLLASERKLMPAAQMLAEARMSEIVLLQSAEEIIPFWDEQRPHGLRAVCLVGAGISWKYHEALQCRGALVGRLPFDDVESLDRYMDRSLDQEQDSQRGRPVVWIIAPRDDAFTRRLDSNITVSLTRALEAIGARVFVTSGYRAELVPEVHAASLVVLMCHGADPPAVGLPVGLDASTQTALMSACAKGTIVVHLGCNGAGMAAGGRFGAVDADRLALGEIPSLPTDATAKFARDCLLAGARAVVAHIDSTWSNAFDDERSIVECVQWAGSGRGTLGWAVSCFAEHAAHAGAAAWELANGGDDEAAGLSWLRCLDLRGFVLLGDPSSAVRRRI